MLSKVIIIRILVSISSEKLFKDIVLRWHTVFLRSRSILPHPPLHRNDCSHSRFARSHPLCGWLWANQKKEVPNVGGIAMVIIRSFGIAETTSFFRIAAPSFYRLSRQSVVNPFPPLPLGGGEIGIRLCLPSRMVCFYFPYRPFPWFSASPRALFPYPRLRSFVFGRQIYFGGWIWKSSGLRPLSWKKITPDGFAVPNIFCRPKLFSIPPSLL